jgi:hypothetical protein
MPMKSPALLLAALIAAAPVTAYAATDGKVCLDPHYSYQARAIGGHDIVAKATLGHDHRELRLSTTCINLGSAFHIALTADFQCLDKGDTVFASTIDGERQSCRITNVQPYVPDAPAQHS